MEKRIRGFENKGYKRMSDVSYHEHETIECNLATDKRPCWHDVPRESRKNKIKEWTCQLLSSLLRTADDRSRRAAISE